MPRPALSHVARRPAEAAVRVHVELLGRTDREHLPDAPGDVLRRLRIETLDVDDTRAQLSAQLKQNQAQTSAAQRQLGVLSAQEQQQQAAISAQEASLKLARINLGYTRIVAPQDGVEIRLSRRHSERSGKPARPFRVMRSDSHNANAGPGKGRHHRRRHETGSDNCKFDISHRTYQVWSWPKA